MDYKKLDVWQLSRRLVKKIYVLSKQFPSEEQFGLTNQIRRSFPSIPSNIAEGCGRYTPNDTVRFLHIARGSLYEVETQLILSNDLGFISDGIEEITSELNNLKKVLNGFINYYKSLIKK